MPVDLAVSDSVIYLPGPVASDPAPRAADVPAPVRLKLYAVPCPTAFRAAVEALADRMATTPSQLVRSAMTLCDPMTHASIADPGDPGRQDRDVFTRRLPDGRSRQVRRIPRLRLRLPAGLSHEQIRRALALALALNDGNGFVLTPQDQLRAEARQRDRQQDLIDRLRQAMDQLAFRQPVQPVHTVGDAAQLFGFQHIYGLDERAVTARYRQLAALFHPDGGLVENGDRMAQLADARRILMSQLRDD